MANGRYREETRLNGARMRVTYEGSDFLWRAHPPEHGSLHSILTVSNTAYIRCKDKLYYINKIKNSVTELRFDAKNFDEAINPEGRFHAQKNPQGLSLNEQKSLCNKDLQWIEANLAHISPDSKKIRNIEFALTSKERRKILRKLHNRKVDSKNSAYTYIFQNSLAKYQNEVTHKFTKLTAHIHRLSAALENANERQLQEKLQTQIDELQEEIHRLQPMRSWMKDLHKLSTHFARFESFINNPPSANPEESLKLLLNDIKQYRDHIFTTIRELLIKYHDHPEISLQLTILSAKLQTNVSAFQTDIQKHLQYGVTSYQAQRLMSLQNIGGVNKSLGTFMAEQMAAVLTHSIKICYEIHDDRLGDLIHMHPAISTLSDAKKLIEIKAFALDGAEYNDTYSAIPETMLENIEHDEEAPNDTERWFSIRPYLSDWSPSEVDKVICLLSGETFENRKKPSVFLGLLKFLASFLEVGLVIVIRFPLTLLFSVVALLGAKAFATRVDQWLSDWHSYLSPVKASKRLWNRYYRRLDAMGNAVPDDNLHQQLLKNSMETSSFFHQAFVYLTPKRIAENTQLFAKTIWQSIKKIPQDISYLFSTSEYQEKPASVFQRKKEIYQLTKWYREQLEAAHKKKYEVLNANELTEYDALRYCPINEISSPLEVFREVMVTLSDTVVDPMFRKSPGASTFYFMVSMITFGTYLAPAAALAWMKSVPAWLQIPSEFLSIHFTGKSATLGIQEQMIACFLEWKLGFFTTELLIEISHGNYDFLNDLFQEPEKLTLGLVGLIAMGVSVQFLPILPTMIKIPGLPPIYNYYAEIMNIFVDEAKGCAEGTFPFTGLEYGFLGLKFAMLMHSMLSGSHAEKKNAAHQKLAQACTDKQFLAKLLRACAKAKLLKEPDEEIRNQHFKGILSKLLKSTLKQHRLDDQFTGAELIAFQSALAEQISPAIQEHLQYKSQQAIANAQNKLIDGPHPKDKLKQYHNDQLQEQKKPKMDLGRAHAELLEAIEMIGDEKNPLTFNQDRLKEANKVYEYLDQLFDNYNHQLQLQKRADLCIDKRDFLAVYYNKYCYQGSNNLIRSLIFFPIPLPVPPYFVPAYVFVVAFREMKRLFAKWFHKPSIIHQVQKSYYKDLVLLYQFAAITARTLDVFNRALTYSLRVIVAIALFSITIVPFLIYKGVMSSLNLLMKEPITSVTWKTYFKTIDQLCCKISIHKLFSISFARPLYALASREAGSNEEVGEAGEKVLKCLEAANELLETSVEVKQRRPYAMSHSRVGQTLELADRRRQKKKASKSVPIKPSDVHDSTDKHAKMFHNAKEEMLGAKQGVNSPIRQ